MLVSAGIAHDLFVAAATHLDVPLMASGAKEG